MPNPFDQFSGDTPGVALQVEARPTQGNPFLQFRNDTPEVNVPASAIQPPAAAQPSLYQSVYENPMLGAEQRAVPHPGQYGQPISTDLFVNDAGQISFRDKAGNEIPTDRSKHVVLQGPTGPTLYSRTPLTTESPLVGGARVLSLGLGPTAPTTGIAAGAAPAAEATIPRLREAATAVYQSPEILSRVVPPADVAASFNEIAPQLRRFDPAITARLENELAGLGRGQITIQDLNHASERLGTIAAETQGPLGQQSGTPAAAAAQAVKGQIDKLIRTAAPEMAMADQNYSAMKAAQTIVGRGDLATVRARGGDFAEKMAQQATTLLANPKYLRGFTPDEVEQLRAISEGRLKGENLLGVAQWLSGKLGTVGGVIGGVTGFQHSGPITGALSAMAGMGADAVVQGILTKMGNRLATNQVNALSEAIRARSPLGQQLAQNAQAWEQAWNAMRSAPSSYTLTALAQASRELSKALRVAGVEVGPAQLMRYPKADQD